MIKHIVGFVLFSFIVGTSAFVYGLIFGTSDASVSEPASVQRDWYAEKKKRKKRKCRKHKHPHPHFYKDAHSKDYFDGPLSNVKARIWEADYNESTGLLKVTISAGADIEPTAVADLHFYVSDEFGVRYLKTETVDLKFDSTFTQEHSFRWLKNFQQREDLFVIAEAKEFRDGFVDPKGFSQELAAKVTLSGSSR